MILVIGEYGIAEYILMVKETRVLIQVDFFINYARNPQSS